MFYGGVSFYTDFYPKEVPFSVTELLDMTPSYENRVRIKGFQPSKALGIRVGEGSTILTFAEVKKLLGVITGWVKTNE